MLFGLVARGHKFFLEVFGMIDVTFVSCIDFFFEPSKRVVYMYVRVCV